MDEEIKIDPAKSCMTCMCGEVCELASAVNTHVESSRSFGFRSGFMDHDLLKDEAGLMVEIANRCKKYYCPALDDEDSGA